MKKTKIHFNVFLILSLILVACHSSKLNCSKFYTYYTKKINIKGISSSLKKQGVEMVSLSVGEIAIEPSNTIALERLQELDLLQFTLCNQIKSLPKNDTLRRNTTLNYINTLERMLQIAQNSTLHDSTSKK